MEKKKSMTNSSTKKVEIQKDMENQELEEEFQKEFERAMASMNEDIDLEAKRQEEEKEKKDHSEQLKKGGSLLGTILKMAMLGILVGSPMLGVLGVLAIKYNKQVMDLCTIINYKPMLIPDVSKC